MRTFEQRRGDSRIGIFILTFFSFLFLFLHTKTALTCFIFRKTTFIPTTPNMSSQSSATSYATASIPTIPNNYLNTEVHINYNESLHSIQEQHCVMLLAMNHLTDIQEMARTINTAATNAANAMLIITPTIKILLGNDFVAAHCLENITDKLVETVKINIEKTVYNLTKQIAYKLKATPDAGTDKEIQFACIIVDTYVKNDTNPPT
jgi:hypothetical protein